MAPTSCSASSSAPPRKTTHLTGSQENWNTEGEEQQKSCVLLSHCAWHSILLLWITAVRLHQTQTERDGLSSRNAFPPPPHLQCKFSVQSHWHCTCLNMTGWGLCQSSLYFSAHSNTKITNTPLSAIPLRQNWASIEVFIQAVTPKCSDWIQQVSFSHEEFQQQKEGLLQIKKILSLCFLMAKNWIIFGNKALETDIFQPNPTKSQLCPRTTCFQLSEKKLKGFVHTHSFGINAAFHREAPAAFTQAKCSGTVGDRSCRSWTQWYLWSPFNSGYCMALCPSSYLTPRAWPRVRRKSATFSKTSAYSSVLQCTSAATRML